MRSKIYYKLKAQLIFGSLKRLVAGKAKHVVLAAILLALILIPSSAKQLLFMGRYQIAYIDSVPSTAYNSMVSQCDSSPWITASGTRCREGVIAANHLPLGTLVMIEGFGNQVFRVEDRMNRRYNRRIDVWFRDYGDAIKYGKRQIKYYVIEPVDKPAFSLASFIRI